MNTTQNTLLTAEELEVFAQLRSPCEIQAFLDSVDYSTEERYRCPRNVLRDRKAHCYDGAVFAAAALQFLGYPPLLVELLPNDRDDDHILSVFRRGSSWGAIAKSNFVGLRYREPVYRNLRELVMSYFESYFNVARERTLLGYTAPLNLTRFGKLHWHIHDSAMDIIGDAFAQVRQYRILSASMRRNLTLVDERSYGAGLMGSNSSGLFKL